MVREYYVYEWYFIDSNEVFHVGKGKGNRAWNTKHRRNSYFKSIIEKYKDNVNVRIYKDNLTNEEACDLERERIKYYWSLNQAKTNFHEGGLGGNTGNYSSEIIEKRRDTVKRLGTYKGENNPMYGKTHTKEVREKISKVHKGKKMSEESRKKMSEGHKGFRHSEESKRKISENNKGKVITPEMRAKISKTLIKHKYTVILNDEVVAIIDGVMNLYEYMSVNYGISRQVTPLIIQGKWKPKFNRHKQFENLKIIKTEIKCID